MKHLKYLVIVLLAVVLCAPCLIFTGCDNQKIKMYDVTSKKIIKISLEDYVAGVTSAEMGDGFAVSALEAQSVIARSYALWFKNNNKSKYQGADISNDITEAQAYTTNVSDKVKTAVKRTKGKVLKYQNNIILPYYCANSGGASSLCTDVFLNNTNSYTSSVKSPETEQNSKDFSWSVKLTKSTILSAMLSLGHNLASVNTFLVNKSDSVGRALTLNIGGKIVNANAFRLAVGSTLLKSCFITNISVNTTYVEVSGKGYGHGVGLSQWGANVLANNGKDFASILKYYFPKCSIDKI